MTSSLPDKQSELPPSIVLFRHHPNRVHFSWTHWNPAHVRSPEDLPEYLILGPLDLSSFEVSVDGWSARWQGAEVDTQFHVTFKADEERYQIRQTWQGVDGGLGIYPSRVPLNEVIGKALYSPFPASWDSAAKRQLEDAYQLTVIEQPENAFALCGIPDGAFHTIAFPIAVRNLRPIAFDISRVC